MRAVRLRRYGGPEVLRVEDADPPLPGPQEIVIKVEAASVNPYDGKVRQGRFDAGPDPAGPVVPGVDAAGVIESVGAAVRGWQPGTAVFGLGRGTYAERAVLHAWQVRPERIDPATAAAAATTGEAAVRVLDLLGLRPGGRLLIDGGAGGVGTVAVQLARRRGLRVLATASEANHDHLRELGATPVRYGPGLADRVREVWPDGPDGVFDVAGRSAAADLIGLVPAPDRVVSIANWEAADTGIRLTGGGGDAVAALTETAAALAAGDLRIPVRTFPLEAAGEAHRLIETGHARGKLVLLP